MPEPIVKRGGKDLVGNEWFLTMSFVYIFQESDTPVSFLKLLHIFFYLSICILLSEVALNLDHACCFNSFMTDSSEL